MHEIRQVIVRMRLGESDRTIARTGLMGRKKASVVRVLAQSHGWLDVANTLPDETVLAQVLADPEESVSTSSSLIVPHREEVTRWWREGIQGTTIHAALVRKYGFAGSYSSVRRFLQGLEQAHPALTTVLEFDPGDAAQVDFGRGPDIVDVYTGECIASWVLVMVLAWSRHMYAEVVRGYCQVNENATP